MEKIRGEVYEGRNYSSEGVEKALIYIDCNIHRPMTLKEVSEHVYLNANYFSVLFRQQVGINFSEYLTRKRMELAKKKLRETNDSVMDISEMVGYQTAKYFTHLFKKCEGVTPSAYRKNRQKSG